MPETGLTPQQIADNPWATGLGNGVYTKAFTNLKNLTGTDPEQANAIFNDLTPQFKKATIHQSFTEGALTEDQYVNAMASIIQETNPRPMWIDDGEIYTYKIGTSSDPADYSPTQAVRIPLSKNQDEAVDYSTLGTVSTDLKTTGKYDDSFVDFALNNPITGLAAAISGPIAGGILTAAKAANGQTLHASDWASLANAGMEYIGGADGLAEAQANADVAGEAAVSKAMSEANTLNEGYDFAGNLGLGAPVSGTDFTSVYQTAYDSSMASAGAGLSAVDKLTKIVETTGTSVEELQNIFKSVSEGESAFSDYDLTDATLDLLNNPLVEEDGVIYNLLDPDTAEINGAGSELDGTLDTILGFTEDVVLGGKEEEEEEDLNADPFAPLLDFAENFDVETADVAEVANVADIAKTADVADVADIDIT